MGATDASSEHGRGNGNGNADGPEPTAQGDRTVMPVDVEQPPRLPFTVVGMGASAGGVEAFVEFFDAVPTDTGMAFVLVQHLPPQRESLMADILSKHTRMPVHQVVDGMLVRPNHVYVIRPGNTLTIRFGKLHLGEPVEKRGHQRPVDDFFRSLAEEQRERAVCVILSGMGSNGTAGAQMVKAVGGVCVAQDPDHTKYPSMPRSLIDAGWADFVLRPREMPEVLSGYANHAYAKGGKPGESLARRDQKHIADILAILRTRTRHDFAGYRKPTLVRRVQRRMGLNQLTQLADYTKLLRQTPAEASGLVDDLLIHVTGFFRDPDAWEAMREKVIVPLVASRADDTGIRCWITACSSGEEAYTLGMLLLEAAEAAGKNFDIKIFATDMAERSLVHARAGIYPGGIESEMPQERLERFFEKDDSSYRIRRALREIVVFAPQNVLQDPPFSRMDVCSCRNLLIYLEPEVQKRVLHLLHFALVDGGALFLGSSETTGGVDDLFEPIDKRARIFRRVGPTRHGHFDFPTPTGFALTTLLGGVGAGRPGESERGEPRVARASIAQMTQRALVERYTPPSIVVDRQFRIVYFHGRTEPYLDQPRGEPTRDLLALARESVRGAIRLALHAAVERQEPQAARDGVIPTDAGPKRVTVRAAPLEVGPNNVYYLISFDEVAELSPTPVPPGVQPGDQQLQAELARTREDLQSTIEAMQATNEEMKAANEEMTSVNEELQSTNEELETSKEELQSLNEELTTVNSQLQVKMEEAQATSNDLSSLLSSTDIAVIFLDPRFRIRRFTPAVKDLIELIAADVGRPLRDLNRKFKDPDLLPDAKRVLERLVTVEREIVSDSGRFYARRTLPYRTTDDRIAGVVVTFVDITARRTAETAVRKNEELLRRVIGIETVGVMFHKVGGDIYDSNDAFLALTGYSRPELAAGAVRWDVLTPPEWSARTREAQDELRTTGRHAPFEREFLRKDGGRWWGLIAGTRLLEDGEAVGYVVDVTQRRRAEDASRASEQRLRAITDAMPAKITEIGPDERFRFVNATFGEWFGRPPERIVGHDYADVLGPAAQVGRPFLLRAMAGETVEFDNVIASPGHPRRDVHGVYVPRRDAAGNLDGVYALEADVTAIRGADAALRESEGRLRAVVDLVPDLLWRNDAAGRATWFNQRWLDYTGQAMDAATGLGWMQALHPDDRRQSMDDFLAAVAAGRAFREERRIRRADGEYRWFLVQGLPLRTPDGSITEWFGAATDIHEQRTAIETLRETAERIRLAVEATHMGFWEWDVATDTVRTEPQHNRILGLPADMAAGPLALFLHCVHPDDRDRVAATLAAVPGRRKDFDCEFRVVRPDGSLHWVAKYGRPEFPDPSAARATRVLGTTLDVTDRKLAELELDERLAREQAGRESAEAASEAKDQFLANVSHELRTPLSAILLWAKMLRGNPATSEKQRQEGLDAIERAANAQRELIEDLLDTSRIVSGKLRLDVRHFQLGALFREAIEGIRPAAEAKRVAVGVEVADGVDGVNGDPDRIRQVIWNLLSNAVKFTPADGRVDVAARRDGDTVEITVADTGRGIAVEQLPHVFDRFWQADSAARQNRGLGLGLAITRQLVELHGGTVEAHSDGEGRGATFRVRLPLPEIAPPARTAARRLGKEPQLTGVRVLLVEDDVPTREALTMVLRTAAAEVTAVGTTAEALAAFEATPPDLILSDIGLPDADGNELIRQIRTIESDRKAAVTPAVALTALARRQDRRRSAESGFQQYLAKPVDPDRLLRTLWSLLER
jgi:two-component system CheB/CheR fusion protein